MSHENYLPETYSKIGKSIFIFNDIEFYINCILCHFIKPADREFFIDYFLNTSVTNFGTKIKMLAILDKFSNKEIELLRKCVNFRNVFAHSNRTHFFDAKVTGSNVININIEDVIYVTNSSGKINKKTYDDFLKEHEDLEKEVINFIIGFVTANDINVIPKDVNNLKRYL